MRKDILGVGFDDLTMDEAVLCARELMDRGGSCARVVTPNPEIVMLCRRDEAAREAVNGADLVLADGIGIIYGARILGRPLRGRVPGIDFASRLIGLLAEAGGSVFLLGARPGVAERAGERLKEQYPGLTVCGAHDGYFTDDEPVIRRINEVKPRLLLVCLGAPKQELWMQANRDRIDAGLMCGLGGSLDVFAGDVERAPEAWRRAGLEWLYRLLKQPSRIGRMMKLPAFLLAAVGHRVTGGRHGR